MADRFGNPQAVVGLKDKKNTGYPKGFVEIKGDLYKVTTSPSNKEGVAEWVTLTKMPKSRSLPFGGGVRAPQYGPNRNGL